MASKKKPKDFTGADRYDDALQRAIKKALWLPEGNDKTVYRGDLAPFKAENKPYKKSKYDWYVPLRPKGVKNKRKNNGNQQA